MTETFLISHDHDRTAVAHAITAQPAPFTVKISEGVDRSAAQNRLAFKWYSEIAKQQGDEPEEVRAECKLTLGVKIRMEDEEFRKQYYEMIRPLQLQQKLRLMLPPLDFPITRDMTTKQMTRYLDAIWRHYVGEVGLTLTEPDPMVGEIRSAA